MAYLVIFGELPVYSMTWYDFSAKKAGAGCDTMKLALEGAAEPGKRTM